MTDAMKWSTLPRPTCRTSRSTTRRSRAGSWSTSRSRSASGHAASGGAFTERTAALLAEETGAEEVLLTTSCTAALELSAMLLDLEPGDTVIVPSFTFTTTALAFARQGAGLVFCDIEPRTLGIDPEHLATLLDENVRAVVVVHYAGIACDIEGIRRGAGRTGPTSP